MEKFNKEFPTCPACGSTNRFFESMAQELIDSGLADPNFKAALSIAKGAVVDKTREASIPIGAEVPGWLIVTDLCLDCGCIYAVHIEENPAKKQIVRQPPKLVRPDQGMAQPHINDPRFS